MKEYIIDELYSDLWERTAIIFEIISKKRVIVYFIEYDECLESGENSKKRKKGDLLKGRLTIIYLRNSPKVTGELHHQQTKENIPSPYIEATIKVSRVVDKYSVYAFSSITDEEMLIEFEEKVNYKIGDTVFVTGTLKLILNDDDEF